MPAIADILTLLRTIDDPEMPISIVDLGIVEHVELMPSAGGGACAVVRLLPTFIGCPAIPMIEQEVRRKLAHVPGVTSVDVRFVFDPPWSVDRISDAGRQSLSRHGVTLPTRPAQTDQPVDCPFCGARDTHVESPFGPTRCRMIYYCESCRNSFEHLKRI